MESHLHITSWRVPPQLGGDVADGTLHITPAGRLREVGPINDDESLVDPHMLLSGFNWDAYEIVSPPGLNIAARDARQLHLSVRNPSPETDILVHWTTSDCPGEIHGPAHAALRPCDDGPQHVVVHLDEAPWEGTLDQLRLTLGTKGLGGDLFVDRISVTGGTPRVRAPKPDVRGETGIPVINVPGLAQEHVEAAFDVLDDAVVYDGLPFNGFPTPFIAPGADGACYGRNWWVLDASLAMWPLLWTHQDFCADMIRGVMAVQSENPDGNINHEGKVAHRGRPYDVSVIPRYFEAVHALATTTDDMALATEILGSMLRYLEWWCSPLKRDAATGLVTCFFEESFSDAQRWPPGTLAPVDLNVAVAVGAALSAEVAERVGDRVAAERCRAVFGEFRDVINRHLWNAECGCYQNRIVTENRFQDLQASHQFDPLRLGIAPRERVALMLERLLDPDRFGWGGIGLTTVSRQDPCFEVVTGHYRPEAWNGGIWTMRNLPIIAGLRDIGRHDLAAELTWQTLTLFAGRYAEFLEPLEGGPHGVQRYAWTAGQWLQALIEHLFGLRWDAASHKLHCSPHVPSALWGQRIELQNLNLPGTSTPVTVSVLADDAETCDVSISGTEESGSFTIL